MNCDAQQLKQVARGRWPEILSAAAGIDRALLDGRHHPCPKCGGEDRFRMIDQEAGAVLCNQCFASENGDGFAAITWFCDCDFPTAVRLVGEYLDSSNGNSLATSNNEPQREIAATYDYVDEAGNRLYQVCRTDQKGFRQRRPKQGGGWEWTVKDVRQVPYRLPELLRAGPEEPIWIAEGEKDCDRLVSLGCIATCNAGGAGKWESEWRDYFQGRLVVILPDNDEPGREHAEQVATSLQGVASSVKVVELPGLPEKGDVSDWLDMGHNLDDLWKLTLDTPEWEPSEVPKEVGNAPRWKPFPVDAIPEPVRRYVRTAAGSIGCDPSFVAIPLLAALASAVGTSTRIALKADWQEPAILWTAIVGDSGTHKSPALKAATRFVDERDAREVRACEKAKAAYGGKVLSYEEDMKQWRKSPKGLPPMMPSFPVCRRFMVADVTVEALADRLGDNPRGILIVRDELAGWLDSFNQYKGGRGADAAAWLSMHNASSLRVDRRTGERKTIIVPSAAVSIAGGIQPPVLARSLGAAHFQDGLAARLLVAMPPKRPRVWTDTQIPPDAIEAVAAVCERLWSLEDGGDLADPDDEPRPVDLPLTPEAQETWIAFYNRHGAELTAMTGDLAAAWSKLEGYAARLALVAHLTAWAAGSDTAPGPVDRTSVEAGIALVVWFKNEVRRVYGVLGESDKEREQRRLVEWIDQRGGRVTARKVQQGNRRFKTSDEAEAGLQELISAGLGDWESVPTTTKGGRPTRVFRRSTASTVYETPENPEENRGSADVDSVDATNEHPESVGRSEPQIRPSLRCDWGYV